MDRLFNKEEYIKSLGYEINDDGTTNNLCAYTQHVRENLAGKAQTYFNFYFIWATVGGAILYYVSQIALNGIINEEGRIWDSWNGGGASILTSMVVSHHLLWSMETRNFNIVIIIGYITSFILFMPLTVMASEAAKSSFYYKEQWSTVFASPIFYLVTIWTALVTAAPRFIWISMQHVMFWPEFSKVKSS